MKAYLQDPLNKSKKIKKVRRSKKKKTERQEKETETSFQRCFRCQTGLLCCYAARLSWRALLRIFRARIIRRLFSFCTA